MSHLQRNIIKLKCQFSPQNRLEGKYYFAIIFFNSVKTIR